MPEYHLADYRTVNEAIVRYRKFVDAIKAAKEELSRHHSNGAAIFVPQGDHHVVIALERGGNPIGFIIWTHGFDPSANTAFVGLAYVHPAYRRKGIYKEMLKRVGDIAFKHGYRKLQLAVAGSNDDSIGVHDAIFGTPEMLVYSKKLTL